MYIELWKWIPGHEGYYMVSTHGKVKSVDRYVRHSKGGQSFIEGKILKQGTNSNGYKVVTLAKNSKNKTYSVHRLVALAFIPNPNNLPCVNHKDENKTNNTVYNLEWCTYEYNLNYGTHNERASKTKKGKYTGVNNPMYGKHHTEESKKKMSEAKKDKGKPILMFTKNNVFVKRFDSIGDANEYFGKARNNANIYLCAKGVSKTAYKFKWKYEEDCK